MWRLRGLYAITPDERDTTRLTELVTQAAAGGARAVQYRSKLHDPALHRRQAQALAQVCRAHGAAFIVNDDVELARGIDADGVHLGREDLSIVDARARLGPNKLIGGSCYNRLELARAAREAGADYVAFGSVYLSRVKPEAVQASLGLFTQAKREFDLPLVAIGGITLDNAPAVIEAGADAIAVISALFDSEDVLATARRFSQLFK